MRKLDKQSAQALLAKQKQADDQFITAFGEEAFLELKKTREAATQASKLDRVTGKLLSESAQLNQLSGVWFSSATMPVVFEAILDEFPMAPIGTPPYRWESVFPNPLLNQIGFCANWPDPSNQELTTSLILQLTLTPNKDGRTALHFKHDVSAKGTDPFVQQIIKLTNQWLRALCARCEKQG